MKDGIELFKEEYPSIETYWRSINLFGRNVASYKFVLGMLVGLGYEPKLVEKAWASMEKVMDCFDIPVDKALAWSIYSIANKCSIFEPMKDICGIDIAEMEKLLANLENTATFSMGMAIKSFGDLLETIGKAFKGENTPTMGHSDIGVTLNTYTHLQFDDALEEMKKLCKVIPSYAKKVYKHTIIGLQQNCGKWLKHSKIKHFQRLNINDKDIIHLPRHKMIAQVEMQCYQGFVRFKREKAHQFYTK